MKLTSKAIMTFLTLIVASGLSGCNATNTNMTIPAVSETNIDEAATTLGVSVDDLNSFFNSIGITYGDYVEILNSQNQSISDLKSNIENKYDCTFKEYVQAYVLINGAEPPSDQKYNVFPSQYSLYDAYVESTELNDAADTLINYNVSIAIADSDTDTYAFDVMSLCNSDFKTYIATIVDNYKCDYIDFSTVTLTGSHGSIQPEDANACINNLFIYDEKTGDVSEQIPTAVLTLHYENEDENRSFALSNELGLIFKATGADSKEKISRLADLDFQIRTATHENTN